MAAVVIIVVVIIVIGLLLLALSMRIVQEYERGVIFRLGRCVGAKGPGVFFIVPIFDKIMKVNLQEMAVPVAPQQVITRDNVTLSLDAVVFLRVTNAEASVVRVRNWYDASSLLAQTALRSVVGHHDLDELLSQREQIDAELKAALDRQTEEWGVEVRRVELRDVDLPEQIQRAMGRQAEAERDRRAKVIAAEGELQASVKLSEAATAMSAAPGTFQLRTLQTMSEIATEQNSTIIFPIPTEVMEAFRVFSDQGGGSADAADPARRVLAPPATVPPASESGEDAEAEASTEPLPPSPPPRFEPPPPLEPGEA